MEEATNAKGRDEQRKLRAALLNNLAVASAIAAVLRPSIKALDGNSLGKADLDGLLILGAAAYILHSFVRSLVRAEDGSMTPELVIALFFLALGGAVVISGELDERRWKRDAKAREEAARTSAE
ncbi:MAG: hypothetical protein JNJ73_02955 [Hyphomonadaceae bacterium]|nr:hypothetical protein [Hyphomonadaceae bacterium]